MRFRRLFAAMLAALSLWTGTALAEPGYTVSDEANRPAAYQVIGEPRRFRVDMRAEFHVYENPYNESIVVTLPLPSELPSQTIEDWSVQPAPTRVITSSYGYRYLQFELGPAGPDQRLIVRYEAQVVLRRIHFQISAGAVGGLNSIPERIRLDYTGDGPYYNLNTTEISKAARDAVGFEPNPYRRIQDVWRFVRNRLRYLGDKKRVSALETLRAGSGTCTEYSFLMIALCRELGIPARYIAGPKARRFDEYGQAEDRAFHKVVEVYVPSYGWVPMESSSGDTGTPDPKKRTLVGSTPGNHMIFVIEPEPNLVDLDPREDLLTVKTSGPGMIRFYRDISVSWKTPEATDRPGEKGPGVWGPLTH